MKVKKPIYNAKELNSNIAYGMTSVNNITQDELDSIQWLCEKSMNDDTQIAELKKQLEEEEKDNKFLEKICLSEKTKNDNYHTEKYGLDKPVQELRKIKLKPEEKDIYYRGFDNCERQFATHIAELQQQLKETKVDLSLARNEIDTLKGNLTILNEHKKIIEEQYLEKCKQLKSQPAEIVEKIKKQIFNHFNVSNMEEYESLSMLDSLFTADAVTDILDDILKEYQK